MALINCKECGQQISDQAVSCPHCGCPTGVHNKLKLKPLHIVVAAVVCFVVILFATNPSKEKHAEKLDSLCKETVSKLSNEKNWNSFASMIGSAFLGKLVEEALVVDSYGIFSVGKFKASGDEATVSIGFLGMVFTSVNSDQLTEKISKKLDKSPF